VILEDGTDRLSQNTIRCVISQKSTDLLYMKSDILPSVTIKMTDFWH